MLRRILLAATLVLGLAPALAQAPPPVPALPDTQRLTSYSISGSTCNCAVGFALYGDGTDVDNWVQVFIGTTRYLSTDPTHGWSLSSPSGTLGNISRPITDAILTFNAAQTGTVKIYGARRPRRTSQFSESRGVTARDLNQALTDIVAQNREEWDRVGTLFNGVFLGFPSGNTNIVATVIGTLTPGHCAGFDGGGNIIDEGGPCTTGGGGGTVGSASQYQFAYYPNNGNAIAGHPNVSINGSNLFQDLLPSNAVYYDYLGIGGPPLTAGFAHGNFSTGVTGTSPTVWISRLETIPNGGNDTEGGQNSALLVTSHGTNNSTSGHNQQTTAISAYAIKDNALASGDTAGIQGVAWQGGQGAYDASRYGYGAVGVFGQATAASVTSSALGAEFDIINNTGANLTWALSLANAHGYPGTPIAIGADIDGVSNASTGLSTIAVLVRGNWDVAIGSLPNSVVQTQIVSWYIYFPNWTVDTNGNGIFGSVGGTGGNLLATHFGSVHGAPTAATCPGFSLTSGSSDAQGQVNMTSGTSCSITFGHSYPTAGFCTVTPVTALSTVQVTAANANTLSVTFGTAQSSFIYHCLGN